MTPAIEDRRSLGLLLVGNVLLAAGLVAHAFLFNFYLREIQLSASTMGHQVASMTLGGLIALFPAGILIDRIGIRAALLIGVVLTTIGLGVTALARREWIIYGAASVIGLGGATCRVSWSPAIMRLTSQSNRARAFTLNVALIIGFGALWTYAAGAAPRWVPHIGGSVLTPTQVALLAGTLLTASAALCYAPIAFGATAPQGRAPVTLVVPPGVRWLLAIIAVWMVAAALVLPFFNIYFRDVFSLPVERIGALFAIVHGATAILLLGAAEAAKRHGPRRMLIAWLFGMAPSLLILAATHSFALAVALYFVQGLIAPATNPLIDQLLLERVPRERHGVVAAWRNAGAEAAGALGASAGGRIIDAGSFSTLFMAAGGVAGVAALLLAGLLRQRPSFRVTTPTAPETT